MNARNRDSEQREVKNVNSTLQHLTLDKNQSDFALQWIDFNLEFQALRKKKKASLSEMGSQIKKPLRTKQPQKSIRKEMFMR